MTTNKTIRIGYSLSLTGPVAENTKSAKLTHEIWEEDINSRGGLLGRRVELICIDDRGDASLVPDIYRDLIDKLHVDLVIGGYGTNTLAASLPVIMERERFLIGLMGLGVNLQQKYPNYFAMIPTGPHPNSALTEGFFELAAAQNPKPLTVAILTADAEFARNPVIGAKENAAKYGFQIVYEETYPLTTGDFIPYLEAIETTKADILFLCSYLQDSVDLVRAISSHHYRPKMVGGAMIGPQSASVKRELGALLKGFVNYEYWLPVPKMNFPGVKELLANYQSRAIHDNVDELGYYVVPLAYAQMQVLEQAIHATQSFDDAKLADYCRNHVFDTVIGNVRFDESGEWSEPRVIQTQFQQVESADIDIFQNGNIQQVVVSPTTYASGSIRYPYSPEEIYH